MRHNLKSVNGAQNVHSDRMFAQGVLGPGLSSQYCKVNKKFNYKRNSFPLEIGMHV